MYLSKARVIFSAVFLQYYIVDIHKVPVG